MEKMKNTMAHRDALMLLKREGCERTAYSLYGEDEIPRIVDDLKKYMGRKKQDGLVLRAPLEDIARELVKIGKAAEAKKPKLKWLAQWETDNCSDGIECRTLGEAKGNTLSCLEGWVVDTTMELCDDVRSGRKTRQEALDDWNYMYWNYSACVMKRNTETGEFEDYWFPSDKECEEIGMRELSEWIIPEDE